MLNGERKVVEKGTRAKKQKVNWHHGKHPTRRFTSGPHGTPAAAGATEAAVDWQMGNTSAEAVTTAAGGAAAAGVKAAADAGSVADGHLMARGPNRRTGRALPMIKAQRER